ncbi:SusD/RagB family nutrient-binding outer membrane lipoprotein [Chondrinema litorale]|uniref:SusD/RagB family nutrient-binding outer membrane lipoprotein n=1 Tax=Chondrinema litorale TaxID=2994555 RepID=UPI00254398C6|nr:SusD/RagB family nutrient-binding outer membrane lipoprotein [Chondrinema litorale]UZR99880.1 SusD/RagB family nutrient-binding outer membrane lipoprotein [Chondrinema litorale]
MKNKFIAAVLTSCMLVFSACDNDKLLELNENPNASLEIDFDYLLSYGMLKVSGERYESWRGNFIYSSTMIQHFAHLGTYWSGDKYLYNTSYSAALWDANYPGAIKTLTHVVDQTEGTEDVNTYAAALIMRTFALHRMTDLYGALPYNQAGRGLDGQENWFPAYEQQDEIYSLIISDLKEARDAFSADADGLGVQDLIYGGDITQWQKFANSLLMRVALRMSNVDPTTAKSVFEEAYNHSAGTFESLNDNAKIEHTTGQGINRNGNSEVFADGNGGEYAAAKPSATLVNWMKENDDPRLMIIVGGIGNPLDATTWNTTPEDQEGMPNGYDSETITTKAVADGLVASADDFVRDDVYSFLNPDLYDYDDPMFFQTYAETEFMLAEAILKGWSVSGTVEEHFTNGVTAALANWEAYDAGFALDAATIDAYITGLDFASASDEGKLELIGEQYWAATFFNHYEAYANWRRLGYPTLTPTNYSSNVTGGTIPRRLIYPTGEQSGNPDNYAAAIAEQGADLLTTRLWWDVE